MSNVTNEDLVLLYYGEHEDPGLAATVAASQELSARFEALGTELGAIDHFTPPERSDDYGADLWMKLSPRLAAAEKQSPGFWKTFGQSLARPRLSLTGAFSLVAVVALAFLLGRESSQPNPIAPEVMMSSALSGADSGRLLTSSVSGHLEQVNLMLTEFAHMPESDGGEAERATDMLVANRLYRKAAQARGDSMLAKFLGELEPMLIELAYEAHRASPATRDRMQKEVRDNLLFKVRLISQQLDSTIST